MIFPLVTRRDREVAAILGHGPPRDSEAAPPERRSQGEIGARMSRVLGRDEGPQVLLHGPRGDQIPVCGRDPWLEEMLEGKHAVRCIDVLGARDPADGSFVHCDLLGDPTLEERPQVGRTKVEEVALESNDGLHHQAERPPTLLDGFHDPPRRLPSVGHEPALLRGEPPPEAAISAADAEHG